MKHMSHTKKSFSHLMVLAFVLCLTLIIPSNVKAATKSPKIYVQNNLVYMIEGDTAIIVNSMNAKSLTVPKTLGNCSKIIIADEAFKGNTVETIYLSDSVIEIGDSAFANCTKLRYATLPKNLTSMGDSVFSNCSKLTSVSFPSSLRSLGRFTFYYCTSLSSVYIPNDCKITSIPAETFAWCPNLTQFTVPTCIKTIDDFAFMDCGLESITVPRSVTSIGVDAFVCSGFTMYCYRNSYAHSYCIENAPYHFNYQLIY